MKIKITDSLPSNLARNYPRSELAECSVLLSSSCIFTNISNFIKFNTFLKQFFQIGQIKEYLGNAFLSKGIKSNRLSTFLEVTRPLPYDVMSQFFFCKFHAFANFVIHLKIHNKKF